MNYARYSNPSAPLPLAETIEDGKLFKTCVPVRFRYVRNTEKSPYLGSKYQQDIEPAGRYVLHNEDLSAPPRGWKTATVELQCPLVLLLNTNPEEVYGPTSWKALLYTHFRSKGRTLSAKLRKAGYDAVVTVDARGDTREIVLL